MTNIYLQMMREVYPHFKDCLIQTFDDNKGRKDLKLAKIINQNNYTDEQMDGILERANQKGCGIFFSVNSMNGLTRNKGAMGNGGVWDVLDYMGSSKEARDNVVRLLQKADSNISVRDLKELSNNFSKIQEVAKRAYNELPPDKKQDASEWTKKLLQQFSIVISN